MKTTLLNASSVERRLSKLIAKHKHISLAVAWGQMTPVAETLLANAGKFESVLFGLDFHATDPKLVSRFADVPNAYAAKNRQGCFHPKIYYFSTGNDAEAIVGSANFTRGGLGLNLEACVHVQGDLSDPFFVQVRRELKRYAPLHLPITTELAESYQRQCNAGPREPRAKNPVLPSDAKAWARINAPLATMSWKSFVKGARADPYHDFAKRMHLMRAVQQLFADLPSFGHLAGTEWKAIAGMIGAAEAKAAGLNHIEWGWFGSMGAAGTFSELIGQRAPALSDALNIIPPHGTVLESDFRAYSGAFTAAFANLSRTGRHAPATRLLAMKRPDVFVCINGGNLKGLAKALSFAPTTLSLENYWERVIEPVQQSPWFNAVRPKGRDTELWNTRVAMLDAIYYAP